MDRFLLKEIVEYPSPPADELEVLARIDSGALDPDRHAETTISLADVEQLQDISSRVYVDPAIRNYIVSIVYVTRNPVPYIARPSAATSSTARAPADPSPSCTRPARWPCSPGARM